MTPKTQTELPGLEREEIAEIVDTAMRYRASKAELKRQTIMLELDVDEAYADLQAAMAKYLPKLTVNEKGRSVYRYQDGETWWEAYYREKLSRSCGVKKVKE